MCYQREWTGPTIDDNDTEEGPCETPFRGLFAEDRDKIIYNLQEKLTEISSAMQEIADILGLENENNDEIIGRITEMQQDRDSMEEAMIEMRLRLDSPGDTLVECIGRVEALEEEGREKDQDIRSLIKAVVSLAGNHGGW